MAHSINHLRGNTMGKTAEKIVEQDEPIVDAADVEAQAKADAETQAANDEEIKLLKEESDAETRAELEAEGKTPEEIEEALKAADDTGEVEIIREGTQPQEKFTQQQFNNGIQKRVKRLNKQVDVANEDAAQSNAEVGLLTEKNKILQMALDQAKQNSVAEVKQPNPEDFDEGLSDPEYVKQNNAFTNAMIAKQVAEQVAKATQSTTDTNSQTKQSEALLSNQVKHYERAEEIGAKDYEETEDQALKVLGNEVANEIISNFDDSHIIMYYLGKNLNEASRISGLLKTNPIKGVAEVGRLSAELKLKPKSKTKAVADPDENVNGDGNTQDGAIDRKLERLRAKAAETGNIKELIEFKRKHKL